MGKSLKIILENNIQHSEKVEYQIIDNRKIGIINDYNSSYQNNIENLTYIDSEIKEAKGYFCVNGIEKEIEEFEFTLIDDLTGSSSQSVEVAGQGYLDVAYGIFESFFK